jgi:uncharacterized membrane protein YraQ (UPF0718 family)
MIFVENFWNLMLASAPWLILGFTIAGIIKILIPQDFLTKHLGGKGFGTTVKASLIGAPLPLCSCGVVPVALSLRKSGASKNSTVSFLVATPETGVDSVSVTYALLGPFMAIVRPIAAVTSGIVAGLLVGKSEQVEGDNGSTEVKSCCASKTKVEESKESACCPSKKMEKETSCCASKSKPATPSGMTKLIEGIKFSYVDLLKDITPWLLIGLVFAAAIETWVPNEFLAQWGDGFAAFVVMALIGVPMYICATASTPIAASLLLSGISPGAVLVFMMAGPATNIGTVGIIMKELGRRAVIAYLSGVILVSFAFGYLVNFITDKWSFDSLTTATHIHTQEYGLITQGLSVMLILMMINAYLPRLQNRKAEA